MAKTLAQKLFIKAGHRIRVINAPQGFVLDDLPENAAVVENGAELDCVHLFVKSIDELKQYAPQAVKAVKYDGLLWIAYPKQTSGIKTDINRDKGWDVLDAAGLRPVTQISIDDTWSALRFRPKAEVK